MQDQCTRQATSPCTKCGGERFSYVLKSGPRAGQWKKQCPACMKRGREAHQDTTKAYEARNRERIATRMRAYGQANRETLAEKRRQRYLAQSPERRAAIQARAAKWAAERRERFLAARRAGTAVLRAIRRGILTRPDICEQCGGTGKRIDAAHHDYSRPLDVRWLCKPCHGRWDRAEPKTLLSQAHYHQPDPVTASLT